MEENKELATTGAQPVGDMSVFSSVEKFDLAQRVGKVFAESTMVPAHFKGNIANCMIALNMAARMSLDPFMVFQNVYIIKGKIGLEAKLAIALINSSEKFEPLQYKFNEEKTECYAYAKAIQTDKVYEGSVVSLKMAHDEGWSTKPGSKWKTLPELMMQYRSAVFFGRVYCPEALMGLYTRDELVDIESSKNLKNVTPSKPAIEEPDIPEAVIETPETGKETKENWEEFITRKQLDKAEIKELESYIADSAESLGMSAKELKKNAVIAGDLDDMLETVMGASKEKKENEPNWWDATKHWSFREKNDLMDLILFGFGKNMEGVKVCDDNAGAFNTLKAALPDTKKTLVKKYDKMFGEGEFNKLIEK